jgi:hypothetical protein
MARRALMSSGAGPENDMTAAQEEEQQDKAAFVQLPEPLLQAVRCCAKLLVSLPQCEIIMTGAGARTLTLEVPRRVHRFPRGQNDGRIQLRLCCMNGHRSPGGTLGGPSASREGPV